MRRVIGLLVRSTIRFSGCGGERVHGECHKARQSFEIVPRIQRIAVVRMLEIAGVLRFPEPPKRIKNEFENGEFDALHYEDLHILVGEGTSNLPSYGFGGVHQEDQMIALGFTIIYFCHKLGFSEAC